MNLDEHVFDLAYYLLKPNVGQRYLKDLIKNEKFKFKPSPISFREELIKRGLVLLPFWDKNYPVFLKETPDFPVILFCKGDVNILKMTKFVTIVGTRKIDDYGIRVLEDLFLRIKSLRKKICFVSGLAYGVDSKVHELCLKYNLPTIGVVAGGLDKNYYRGNSIMYKYLCQYKLVLSEFPPGREYFKAMFPLRNRILAGLSPSTFIIQAGGISGSLNTATHANNYGRDAFVIPNNIYSDVGRGCLKLIKDGACVILDIDDLVDKIIK